ncbi:DUF4153 domain-containing protein [Pedobacter sp. MC2016-15]|uniref:DUF4153 domain-containing protein n=1 Tax=Pedobacter sp. MC2016-15 TaxID=2994473 RepID=UPI00224672AA|nr:DUF4153 domain-containing protein [Pedobacter sp. MC2016-15]MCX2478234.1 DUF4153 domain-containing protein [Pedobacter sp. MC2016-15]
MALPSIQNLVQDIKYVIARFPLEIAFAVIGTIAATQNALLGYPDTKVSSWCLRVIFTANLGLLFSLSASLYLESRNIKGPRLYLIKIIVALLASCLIFFLNPVLYSGDYIRFFLLSLAGHLLVSFAAYIHVESIQGFWQFNKTIFIRFLTGMLNSGVLYLGLAAALGATKFLFNIDISSKTYTILFIFIAGIFNTTFFLAGIPKDLDSLNNDFSYPKGLKIFTQYVLIPLASIYVVILLAYEAKILIEWNLPKGLVSNLILGYAVFGILAILMIFPIREQDENTWIKTYARSFYFLMLPLIVLLFLAVGARVFRYGITENRYFLIMLAVWLLIITIYSLTSRKQNIKLIPISLCIFTLLSIYGPQSALSVSKYSQTKILTEIFKRNNALQDNKLVKPKKISDKDGNQAARTLRYIVDNYEYSSLKKYVNIDLDHIADSLENTKAIAKSNSYNVRYELRNLKVKWLQDYLGLKEFSTSDYDDYERVEKPVALQSYHLQQNEPNLMDIKGYDYIVETRNHDHTEINHAGLKIYITDFNKESGQISLQLNNDSTLFDVKALVNNLLAKPEQLNQYKENKNHINATYQYQLPAEMLSITQETKNFRITLKLGTIHFDRNKSKTIKDFYFYDSAFLIKVK